MDLELVLQLMQSGSVRSQHHVVLLTRLCSATTRTCIEINCLDVQVRPQHCSLCQWATQKAKPGALHPNGCACKRMRQPFQRPQIGPLAFSTSVNPQWSITVPMTRKLAEYSCCMLSVSQAQTADGLMMLACMMLLNVLRASRGLHQLST